MSITKHAEWIGMQKASEAVAFTLKEMRNYAHPGMTTKQLDNYGGQILRDLGAKKKQAGSHKGREINLETY